MFFSRPLFALSLSSLLALTGCPNLKSVAEAVNPAPAPTTNPSAPVVTATAAFDSATTAWAFAGVPVTVDVSATSGASLMCRTARTSAISSASFASCTPVAGKISLAAPLSGGVNGTFTFQVKAIKDGLESALGSVSFYAHDSLSTARECVPARTNAQYFAAAGALLDQSKSFGPATRLVNPTVTIDFPGISVGNYLFVDGTATDHYASIRAAEAVEVLSLRKRFVKNSAGTLLLVTRHYDQRYGPNSCVMKVRHTKRVDLAGGILPPNPSNPVSYYGYDTTTCEAIVMNALGKAICFAGSNTYHAIRMRGNLHHSGKSIGGTIYKKSYSNFVSNKFKASERADYDATVAAAGSSSGYVFLDD